MKLLFDQNRSHRLCEVLAREYPGAAHVRAFGLQAADDAVIWTFAIEHGYTIVSTDDDFHQRSFLHGHPPKVIWIRLGNCTIDQIIEVLRRRVADLAAFDQDPLAAFLVLS